MTCLCYPSNEQLWELRKKNWFKKKKNYYLSIVAARRFKRPFDALKDEELLSHAFKHHQTNNLENVSKKKKKLSYFL